MANCYCCTHSEYDEIEEQWICRRGGNIRCVGDELSDEEFNCSYCDDED